VHHTTGTFVVKKKKKKRIEQSEQVNEDGEKNEISATTMLIYSEPLLLFIYIYTLLVNIYCITYIYLKSLSAGIGTKKAGESDKKEESSQSALTTSMI
jgi:hypothetical protein